MKDETPPPMNPLPDELVVQCVHCFEWVAIHVDPQDRGVMVQDCDVCCRPLQITVSWMEDGQPALQIAPGN